MGEYERLLLSIKTTARKELVLLHPERSVPPGSTREWLKTRPWIQAHHHVEMSGIDRAHSSPISVDPKAVKALRTLKEKLETSFQRYKGRHTTVVPGRPQHFSDFARLARRLRGKSVGLVLGGGGARGCAHIGVLRALEERGIPIDMVGGTSIGSLIGGLYAKEAELVSTLGRAKKFSGRMASLWRFASDLTYPVVSYTTGHEFNRGIFKVSPIGVEREKQSGSWLLRDVDAVPFYPFFSSLKLRLSPTRTSKTCGYLSSPTVSTSHG